MAGHSRWKNIQHRKGRQDAKKGQLFAKVSRQLYIAAKQGDKNPENNQKLRAVILKAKSYNMPQKNIDAAIQKAAHCNDVTSFVEMTYEGNGPGGASILLDVLTDNKNRISAELRQIFGKYGCNLCDAGSISWMFHWKGIIIIDKHEIAEPEKIINFLGNNIEEMELRDNFYEIITMTENFDKTLGMLEQKRIPFKHADVTMLTPHILEIDPQSYQALDNLIEDLDNHDDIQNIYTNVELVKQIVSY